MGYVHVGLDGKPALIGVQDEQAGFGIMKLHMENTNRLANGDGNCEAPYPTHFLEERGL